MKKDLTEKSIRFLDAIDSLINDNGKPITAYALAKMDDTKTISESKISHIRSGRNEPSDEIIDRLVEMFPEVDRFYILTGEKHILENKHGNKFTNIGGGKLLMSLPTVPVSVQASYMDKYNDVEYLQDLPQTSLIVNKFHHGRYVSFIVEGDSMDSGDSNSFTEGSIIKTRELDRVYWKDGLRLKKRPYWVIYSKDHGKPLFKKIIKQDMKKGVFVCHSLNKDKEKYRDFEVKIDNVNALFYVIATERIIGED